MRLSERSWFRWTLAAIFVGAMFSLPWALGHPPQEQTNYEPAHHAKSIVAPVPPDERVADYTEALAWLTGLLALISVIQGVFLYRSDQTARISAEAAKISAEAARDSAEALPTIERAHVYPTINSIGAIQACMLSANRFFPDGPNDSGDKPCDATAELTFQIRNIGKTPAIIKAVFVGYGVGPIDSLTGLVIQDAILGTNDFTDSLIAKMQRGLTRNEATQIIVHLKHVAFVGEIIFDDIWGREFKTTFHYAWEYATNRMQLLNLITERTGGTGS